MIKIDNNSVKEELTKQNNFNGYTRCCYIVLSIIQSMSQSNKDIMELNEKMNTMIFWRKSIYYNYDTNQLRFVFIMFVNMATKEMVLFQFSFDKNETLKLCAVFLLFLDENKKIKNNYSWCFLVSDNGEPYGLSEFDYMFIENYIKEIKPNILALLT